MEWMLPFPGSVYRARVTHLLHNMRVAVELDLGFGVTIAQVLRLYNANLPSLDSNIPSEVGQASALLNRLGKILEEDAQVYVVIRKIDAYYHAVFFVQGPLGDWRNVVKDLVDAGLCAWQNPEEEPETLEE